ncbi:hypothetical protein N7519_005296 [Penicillium mononematosum]|uniref:uncharacterized protein n=1 Tax=Penicillium mononematosum TaxID=268346 RepID=UPI0025497194|nr:uncharacterized protein N7519_005296 [Penicillium mononematosum]KAJ6183995.1 hypothetical protein N7519_005296 [Penicillium mononematosum]
MPNSVARNSIPRSQAEVRFCRPNGSISQQWTQVPEARLKPMEKRPRPQEQASIPWRRDPGPRSQAQPHGEETQAPGASLNPMKKRPDYRSKPQAHKETQVLGASLNPMEKRPRSEKQASTPWRRDPGPRSQAQPHGEGT